MAKIEAKHDVRRKVREAQAQANRERLKTESDNREDMVAFLVAQQKLTAVDEWESDRHEQVRLEADQRREEQRLEGARALARMRHRGESMASIAQIGGCSEKIVRSYLKELRTSVPGSAADGRNGSQAPAPGAQEVFPLAARGAEVEGFRQFRRNEQRHTSTYFNTARRKQLNLDSFEKSVAESRCSGRRLLTSGLTFGSYETSASSLIR